jgi:SAM-dependent methyltransferase
MRDGATKRDTSQPMVTAASPFIGQLLDFYEATAGQYNGWAGKVNRTAAVRLVDTVKVRQGDHVLDVGCGTGLATHLLSVLRRAGHVMGVDVSRAMLRVAEKTRPTGSTAELAVGEAERLFLRDERFDAVVMGQVLAYLPDPELGLAEARRVLRPGGRIVVSCQRRSLCTEAETVFFALLTDAASPFRVPRPPDHHAMLGEPWMLTGLIEEAGFTDLEVTQMVVGDHTPDPHSFVQLMRLAGPWPHAVLGMLGSGATERFETRLAAKMEQLDADANSYHRAFTFVSARKV